MSRGTSVSPKGLDGLARKRAFKACLHCRSRKAKCEFEGIDFKPPCLKCRREGKECQFIPSRRGGHRRSSNLNISGISKGTVSATNAATATVISTMTSPVNGGGDEIVNHRIPLDPEAIVTASLRNPSDAVEMMAMGNTNMITHHVPYSQLAEVPLIKSGLLTQNQLKTYVSTFFTRYHHYMPIIPESRIPLNDKQLAVFASEEPFLLCAMIAIASRFQSLTVHRACWKYLQSEISNLVWGVKADAGAIEALLLISDNIPLIVGAGGSGVDNSNIHDYQERMSWNLVGLAIRNSYLLGFDQKTLLSVNDVRDDQTHRERLIWTYCFIYDRQASIKVGKAFWSRGPGLCFQNQPGFGLSVGQTSRANFPTLVSPFSRVGDDYALFIQALVEVTQILTNVHDTLYPNKDRTIALAEVGDYCRLLDEFTRSFTEFEIAWEPQQWSIFPLNELVWMSFHYSALYAYSFGFQAHIRRAIAMVRLARRMNNGSTSSVSSSSSASGSVSMSSSSIPSNSASSTSYRNNLPMTATVFPRGVTGAADSKYILESIKSATQIVSICVNDLCTSGEFAYLPFRFYDYVSYAAVFLIKAVFTGAIVPSSQPATLALLDRLIRQLGTLSSDSNNESEDFLHPCSRIANQLKIFMESLLSFNNESAFIDSNQIDKRQPNIIQDFAQDGGFQIDAQHDHDLDELAALLTSDVNRHWRNQDDT